MKNGIYIFSIFLVSIMNAQEINIDHLPYYEIPDYPETFTAGTVAARMIDGLGLRYYWATESLRPEDLNYKPSESGRATSETIEHIYGLSKFIKKQCIRG